MFGVCDVDGLPFPSFFPKKNYYVMRDLSLRPNDVLLCTYPKCGTNWAAYIIWGLMHPDEPAPSASRVQMDIPYVDFVGLRSWENTPEEQGRTFFTHLPADRVQQNNSTKYVVVIRNPLDCCVSYYYFWKGLPDVQETVSDPEYYNQIFTPTYFFDHFLTGDTAYGDYFQHLKSWYNLRNKENVHLVLFESLKTKPKEEILRLAKFLGLEKPLEASNYKFLDKIVEQSSFSVMKKNLDYGSPMDKKPLPLLRKGEIGSYGDTLTSTQIEILRQKMEQELEGTDILDLWRGI